MFIVVSYDIADDNRRLCVSRALEDFGTRVQYSVFECYLDARQLARVQERLGKLIEPKEDSIRYYRLCEGCVGRVEISGQGQLAPDPAYYMI